MKKNCYNSESDVHSAIWHFILWIWDGISKTMSKGFCTVIYGACLLKYKQLLVLSILNNLCCLFWQLFINVTFILGVISNSSTSRTVQTCGDNVSIHHSSQWTSSSILQSTNVQGPLRRDWWVVSTCEVTSLILNTDRNLKR